MSASRHTYAVVVKGNLRPNDGSWMDNITGIIYDPSTPNKLAVYGKKSQAEEHRDFMLGHYPDTPYEVITLR